MSAPPEDVVPAAWADLLALTDDDEIDAAVSPETIEVLASLGREARALERAAALEPRPLSHGVALVALAGQRIRRGDDAGGEVLFERARPLFAAARRSGLDATSTELALEALARRDDPGRALELADRAREALPRTNGSGGAGLGLVVHAYLSVDAVEAALDLYVDREPSHDAGPFAALAAALVRRRDVDRLGRLARFAPSWESDLRRVLSSFAACCDASACTALAEAAPQHACAMWTAHVDAAIAAGQLGRAREAMSELERCASQPALVERWHALGDRTERDAVLGRMCTDLVPWDARRAQPIAFAPVLALCGKLEHIDAALAADVEMVALRAGRPPPSYHTTRHVWQRAILGETLAEVARGALDAAHASGSAADEERVLAWARELARCEPEARLRPRVLGELAAVLTRIGRTEESERTFDEALALAVDLRGTWSGYPVRSTALSDLSRIALHAGRYERALAITKKLGRGAARDWPARHLLENAVERDDPALGLRAAALLAAGHPRVFVLVRALRSALARAGAAFVLPVER